jgi:N4-(beta-N-acetylglucosaminyl)-L-asparaginase
MTQRFQRRSFLLTSAATLSAAAMARGLRADETAPQLPPDPKPSKPPGQGKPIVISSANGLKTVTKAMELIQSGVDPLDAAIAGVAIVEADPSDHSVGLGGIPNSEGVVELDAAVMHGASHKGGAVASLRNIVHPAAVARLVMQRTDHCLLVGEGALRFARMHGFPEVDLLTDESRKIWLHWKETLNDKDDLIPPPYEELDPAVRKFFGIREHGTIHCSALDTHGDLGCTTTTSGLYYKVPGRVGDSPILGAGLYLSNDVGSAGSTGRGEANLLNLSSFLIVENMRKGLDPKDAALEACKRVVANNREPRLRDPEGRPKFDVKFYAISKDGRFGGASLWAGAKMAVHDGKDARLVDLASVFDMPVGEEL